LNYTQKEKIQMKILLIDFGNYDDYPIGGYLSFAKNMMISFGDDLALVGITTTRHDPIGKWFKKNINGVKYDYFAIAHYSKTKTKHIVPDRIVCYSLLKYYINKIIKIEIPNIFIRRPEVLLSLQSFSNLNICFSFAGVENPLLISKYWYSKYVAETFEQLFFKSLKKATVILAAGDDLAIKSMVDRSKGKVAIEKVVKFPTRINTDIFKPCDRWETRKKLNIPQSSKVVMTTGRLSWLKGWKFMIDCFSLFKKDVDNSIFYMVGEGEELQKIQEYINREDLQDKVFLVGRKEADEVAEYLNASDLFIMGSYKEGWSTSLIEAIACGVPACVTNFSSANEIIKPGFNGYVIDNHNTLEFLAGMKNALNINKPIYAENVKAFAANKLKDDILNTWRLI